LWIKPKFQNTNNKREKEKGILGTRSKIQFVKFVEFVEEKRRKGERDFYHPTQNPEPRTQNELCSFNE